MSTDSYEHFLQELARKRAPALVQAELLLAEDRYDQAERCITSVDDSIYGGVEIERMYQRRLEALVAAGHARTPRALETFRRGLRWAQNNYPEPHTEYEAADYERGRAEDHARLVKILGYDPTAHPGP